MGDGHHVSSRSQKHHVNMRDAGRCEKWEELVSAWCYCYRRLMGREGWMEREGGRIDDDGDGDGDMLRMACHRAGQNSEG